MDPCSATGAPSRAPMVRRRPHRVGVRNREIQARAAPNRRTPPRRPPRQPVPPPPLRLPLAVRARHRRNKSGMRFFKRYFVTGLLIWIPLVITIWVITLLIGTLDRKSTRLNSSH